MRWNSKYCRCLIHCQFHCLIVDCWLLSYSFIDWLIQCNIMFTRRDQIVSTISHYCERSIPHKAINHSWNWKTRPRSGRIQWTVWSDLWFQTQIHCRHWLLQPSIAVIFTRWQILVCIWLSRNREWSVQSSSRNLHSTCNQQCDCGGYASIPNILHIFGFFFFHPFILCGKYCTRKWTLSIQLSKRNMLHCSRWHYCCWLFQ